MRKRWLWLITVIIVAAIACQTDEPDLLVPDEELIEILIDLHIADGAMQRVPAQWKDSIGAELRSRVAITHGMTPLELEEMIGQLQLMPPKSAALYDSVIVRLERQQESIE